jgi:carbamate kinase
MTQLWQRLPMHGGLFRQRAPYQLLARLPRVSPVDAGTAVVAVGGNALLRGGMAATVEEQFKAARRLAPHIRAMVERGWRLVVTHGNGPQVGFILRRSELAAEIAPELPRLTLDVCVADSQGDLGYLLGSTLAGELRPTPVATLLTHTVVDPDDPAFAAPSKPIGGWYPEAEARRLATGNGWTVAEDAGRGWRRVVPSPRPRRIVEEPAVRALLDAGFVVVAAGGGGIPVVEDSDGRYRGVEAVVDKDHASALLATALGADLLVITTGVSRLALDYGTPRARPLKRLRPDEVRRHLADGQFPPGSMGPKVEAALRFLEAGGAAVLVTAPERLTQGLRGDDGTWISPPRGASST